MGTNLTDFSREELTYLGVLLTNEKQRNLDSLRQIESFEATETSAQLHKDFTERLDMCVQMDTKVKEAWVEVYRRELATLN